MQDSSSTGYGPQGYGESSAGRIDRSTDGLTESGICFYFAATGCITHFKMITTIADAFNDDQTKVLDEFLFRSVSNSFVHIYG